MKDPGLRSHGNTFGFLTFIFVSSSAIALFDVCP